eukprot:TRINITY_DN2796_c0_g2_i1.p1 TRINITY_DN2796_c0_g2~~TRINITY_DN2796_c0_g2_i1.p1  ORF type:complete len:990 (+),score=201.47 TRINITY_DN2796_c0_g2_i1:73-3042(+)
MSCCSPPEKDAQETQTPNWKQDLERDVDGVKKYGPAPTRGCTDCWCLIVLLAAWGAYLFVTFLGFMDGNPQKLAMPRDYQGAYCDVKVNWNNGPDLAGFTKLSYTMNVTASTDILVKQMMCSTLAQDVLLGPFGDSSDTGGLLGTDNGYRGILDKEDYMCACCLIACSRCTGSLQVGGDLVGESSFTSTISGKINDLRGLGSPEALFDPGAANGKVFTDMWAEATKYFNQVCLPSCNENFATMNTTTDPCTPGSESDNCRRTYVYNMSADNELKKFYEAVKTEDTPVTSSYFAKHKAMKETIASGFTFDALPKSQCPYPASKCVPMPGLEFDELQFGYCSFKMAAEVVNKVGETATAAFVGLGGEAFASSMGENLGKWVGDFVRSIDTFICVCLLAFVVGFIYMVLLRLMIGICVCLAILVVFFMLVLSGFLCYIRSVQCAGSGIFETGQHIVVALGTTAFVAGQNLVNQEQAKSEAMGDAPFGLDYRGAQFASRNGNLCIEWGSTPASSKYNLVNFPSPQYGIESDETPGQTNHFCRNPYRPEDRYKASTIWCYTSNPEVRWEECTPIGVISPECKGGYDITNPDLRKVLEIVGYIIWGLAVIYVLLIVCLTDRIRLAVAVNKVASVFVSHTPGILLLPAVQAVVAAIWCLAWAASAAFLLSQVPADYVPTEAFKNYSIAYGTADTPGMCTDKWPTGFVWKDEDNCQFDANGEIACWRCAPPRYAFDWRFAVSFFVFLWNNALNVAIGQCVVAGAVCTWFFTRNEDKPLSGCRSIRTSLYNVFRYHLGSLAFGSFIIAVIQFIRYLMKYYEKQAQAQKNRVLVLILKIAQCCIWCLEKCVKFLNKNAYIQIALKGTNFCTSAKNAFYLILRNIVRIGTVAILGSAIQYVGIAFIMGGTAVVGYFLFAAMHPGEPPVIPVIVYVVVGYVVAKLFTAIFDLAVSTTLQCFICCEEMELGESGPDGFVPNSMRRWLDKNKKPEELVADDKE